MVIGVVAKNMCSIQSPGSNWPIITTTTGKRLASWRKGEAIFACVILGQTAMTEAVTVVAAAMAGARSSCGLSSTAVVGSGDSVFPVPPARVAERVALKGPGFECPGPLRALPLFQTFVTHFLCSVPSV